MMGWMAPLRHRRAKLGVLKNHQEWEPSMSEITTIGLDLAKHVFQVHGIDAQGRTVLRERLVRQRTMLVNALRAHLAEFGIVAAQGLRHVGDLIAIVRDDCDTRLPDVARQVLQVLANQIEQIETAVAALERQLLAWHKSNPVSQRLASIPGIWPIIATAIATTGAHPKGFRSGREVPPWPGFVPRDTSTGGETP